MYRGIGDRHFTAMSLTNIGDCALACGDQATARQSWQQALEILTELAHADADRVRERLRTLPAERPIGTGQRAPDPRGWGSPA
jgi:predicted negative regulator of RcsB-dependent stress response